jgi:GNAT superfamily N-acetyltransferase
MKNNCLKVGSLLSLFFVMPLAGQALTFSTQPPMQPTNEDPNAILQEKIVISADQKPVGFLNYCSYYSAPQIAGIYSLYVEPTERGKGYAKKLLLHTISYLQSKNYKKILVSPGPFEYQDGHLVHLDDPALKERLVRLYQQVGFTYDYDNQENLSYTMVEARSPWVKGLIIAGIVGLLLLIWFVWPRAKKYLY